MKTCESAKDSYGAASMSVPNLSALVEELARLLAVRRAAQQIIHLWAQGKMRGLAGYENEADKALLTLREALDHYANPTTAGLP